MSAEQSLTGAMGIASWRSHQRLRDHAAVAPLGQMIGGRDAPVVQPATVLGLNEVGVTDLVMAALWRHGPHAASYAVTGPAEHNHLGADIAILRSSAAQIVLYQAKLARLEGAALTLKSPVTEDQLELLQQPTVELEGATYQVTGRLALYQCDHTPYLYRCGPPSWYWPWSEWRWPMATSGDALHLGGRYYEQVLATCECSPSGVLAASVATLAAEVVAIDPSSTWPWEFDFYEWNKGNSPLDNPPAGWRLPGDTPPPPPEFSRYIPTGQEALSAEATATLAAELREQLGMPETTILYIVALP
jgi:hypothetical protein